MTAISSPSPLARRALAALALAAVLAAPVAAQSYAYGRAVGNDLGQCAAGKGPAVRVTVTGLKSSAGNLFVRAYPAQKSDWLVSKRYVIRVDAKPQAGSMTVCVPLPSTGDFAIAVQHDVNGNRKTDITTDGAGMSNNPGFKKVLGIIPQAPPLEKVRFSAGPGVTRMTISMIYL